MLDDALTGVEASEGPDHHGDGHGHGHGHGHGQGHGHAEGAELTPTEAVRDALPGVLLALYEQERPTPHDDLLGALSDHLLGAFEVSADDAERWQAAGAEALDLELADLESWGVLERLDQGYVLTPLGVWSVRELLIGAGYTAPVVGDLADLPADAMVEGLALHRSEETADEEIDLWLARRAPAEAARELVRTMAEGTPGTRTLASAVLDRLDPVAQPAVREGLETRETRPYTALWLREHGADSVELTPAELTWLFVDTVAGLLETTEPDVAISTTLADHGPDLDLASVIEELWRVDHPDVAEVLEALGDHHPDRQLAKAARKAAFKARSRPAGH
jgi:hypothetical protein